MPAERSRNRQRVSRRIVRRSDVDIARSRSTRPRPAEASLMTLRLQTGRYAIHDVQVPSELEVRVAVDRENSISRIERAVRVGPRRIRVESQAVGGTVAGSDNASVDHYLPTARALLGDGESRVDRKWGHRGRRRCGRSALLNADRKRCGGSEIGRAECGNIVHVGRELICIGLTDSRLHSSGITTGSGGHSDGRRTNQVELFAHWINSGWRGLSVQTAIAALPLTKTHRSGRSVTQDASRFGRGRPHPKVPRRGGDGLPLQRCYGIRPVAILKLSTHMYWSTGDPSPMYGAIMS